MRKHEDTFMHCGYRVLTNTGKSFEVHTYSEMAIETDDIDLYVEIANSSVDNILSVFEDPNETVSLSFYYNDPEDAIFIETVFGYNHLEQYKLKKSGSVFLRLIKPHEE